MGELAEGRVHFEESLALFRQTGDSMIAAQALNKPGDVARGSADHGRAAALYAKSIGLMRQHTGDSGIPGVLHNLAYAAHHQSHYRQALAHFGEALLLFRATGVQRGVAECLLGVAALALGQPDRAVRLSRAANACLQTAAIASANLAEYAHTLPAARARLRPSACIGTAGLRSHVAGARQLPTRRPRRATCLRQPASRIVSQPIAGWDC